MFFATQNAHYYTLVNNTLGSVFVDFSRIDPEPWHYASVRFDIFNGHRSASSVFLYCYDLQYYFARTISRFVYGTQQRQTKSMI